MSYYRHASWRPYGSGSTIGFPSVTPVLRALMIACGLVWGAQFLLLPVLGVIDLAPILGLVPSVVVRGGLWQLVTWMFLHSTEGPYHLLINLLILWMMGGDLERHWGGRRFLTYYLVCGVGSGVFVTAAGLLADPPSSRPDWGQVVAVALGQAPYTFSVTLGASGAIYGLLLAFGMIFSERTILFMLIFPMRARTFALVMFAVAFVFTVGYSSGGISHIAHLGGMVVGYLVLKRAWRPGGLYRDIRWRVRRRRFRVAPPRDEDSWLN